MGKWVIWMVAIALVGCTGGGNEQKVSADEQERPADWSAEWKLTVQIDSDITDRDRLKVLSFQSSAPISELVDQLYQLSFSGDAEVYAPTLFGEIDRDQALDPKELVEYLKVLDTVTVEDLHSFGWKDTVIDNSFSLQKVSALNIAMAISTSGELQLEPVYAGFGVQVFDENTGKRRGDLTKFYLSFPSNASAEGFDKLKVYTDSLAYFVPSAFEVYSEESKYSLSDYVRDNYGGAEALELRFNISFSFKDADLRISDVSLAIRAKDEAA